MAVNSLFTVNPSFSCWRIRFMPRKLNGRVERYVTVDIFVTYVF